MAGFTILEVAVVMTIIGILIGGLFLGMNLYHNARILATYSRAEAIRRATEEFIAQYEFLPGDMPNAVQRFALCNAPCQNGNGNGVVGQADQEIFFGQVLDGSEEDETALFWYHLAASGLFEGMNIDAAFVAGTDWGQIYPAAPAGGGYHVRTMGGFFPGLNGQRIKGLFIRWQADPEVNANAGNFIVSPRDAMRIDTKFDDGLPLSGKVRARGNAAFPGNDGCRLDGTTYIQNENDPTCYMYFRIREASGL